MTEEWREIDGYPERMVSNLGRIRSTARGAEKILKSRTGKEGYYKINLSLDGKIKTHSLHRLVLTAFKGKCPDGCEASHLDGNRSNNCADNLVWESKPMNMQRKKEHGTWIGGQQNPSVKLTKDDALIIRKLYSSGIYSYSKLGKQFKVSRQSIGNVVRRKTWSHI